MSCRVKMIRISTGIDPCSSIKGAPTRSRENGAKAKSWNISGRCLAIKACEQFASHLSTRVTYPEISWLDILNNYLFSSRHTQYCGKQNVSTLV